MYVFLWKKQKTNPKPQTKKPPIDFLSCCWHRHTLFSKKQDNAVDQCTVVIQHSGLSPVYLDSAQRVAPAGLVIQYFCVWLTQQATVELQSLMAQSFTFSFTITPSKSNIYLTSGLSGVPEERPRGQNGAKRRLFCGRLQGGLQEAHWEARAEPPGDRWPQ